MIPSFFVFIDKICLNANGKVDKKSLPAPDVNSTFKESYVAPRNETEEKLCEIWSQVLGVERIGIYDNFFELGGHSLLLLFLYSKLKKVFVTDIVVADLFTHPTIASLINLLNINRGVQDCLLPIKPNGSKVPLFLVHPAGGVTFIYRGLADYLKDIPIYGLNNPYMENNDEQFNSIEDMAAYYVGAIQEVCPTGPYRLGGYSFGGLVAYEMAVQLKAKGYKVESVTLIDSTNLSEMNHIISQEEKEKKHVLSEEEKVLHAQMEKNEKLAFIYMPSSYKGRVILLRANSPEEKDLELCRDADLGWNSVLELPLENYSIEGKHEELFDENHLPIIAEKLEYILQDL